MLLLSENILENTADMLCFVVSKNLPISYFQVQKQQRNSVWASTPWSNMEHTTSPSYRKVLFLLMFISICGITTTSAPYAMSSGRGMNCSSVVFLSQINI